MQCIKQVKGRQSPVATCLSSIKSCVCLDSDSQILIVGFPNAVQSVRKPVPLEDAALVEPVAGGSDLFVHGSALPYSVRGSTAGKHACTVCCELVQYIFPTLDPLVDCIDLKCLDNIFHYNVNDGWKCVKTETSLNVMVTELTLVLR